MTFNVENLFDTTHDEGRDDHTYLPLALKKTSKEVQEACAKITNERYNRECLELDWSEKVLQEKFDRISEVMKQVGNGQGPDIQIFAEVENQNVVNMLIERNLKGMGYQTAVVLEGPDNRGIDPGVISRFPQWDKARLHLIPYKGKNPHEQALGDRSRGILEVRLMLPNNTKVSVFAVHFPSQSNPTYLREQAVNHLNLIMSQLPADVLPIAGGDFNVIGSEDKQHGYFDKTMRANWMVSHQVGCKDCKGTSYFRPDKTWSFLDVLNFGKAFDRGNPTAKWVLDTDSIRLPNDSGQQKNKWGEPIRFDVKTFTGVSDHWPVYAEILATGF